MISVFEQHQIVMILKTMLAKQVNYLLVDDDKIIKNANHCEILNDKIKQ